MSHCVLFVALFSPELFSGTIFKQWSGKEINLQVTVKAVFWFGDSDKTSDVRNLHCTISAEMLLKMMIYEYLEETIFKQKPDYWFIFMFLLI